jgi:glucosylglycerate synthase
VTALPQPAPPPIESIDRIDRADLVIGILAEIEPGAIARACDALRARAGAARIVVVHGDQGGPPAPIEAAVAAAGGSLSVFPWSAIGAGPADIAPLGSSDAYHSLFVAGARLDARACCVIASTLEDAPPEWIGDIAAPLLDSECDLVLPYYPSRPFEGLLNSSIVGPLTRSLYGKRLHNPMGPDVGVSRRVVQKVVSPGRPVRAGGRAQSLASLAPGVLCDNGAVCQVHVGARVYPPPDWLGVSGLLAQLLGSIYQDMERHAVCWQRVRGSAPVETRGERATPAADVGTIDITRLIDSFQLGIRDLHEIWGLVLPPATLWELRKVARLAPADFHMRDELWAHIVYDFALGHRLQPINRDHLLRSLTPLYLGWVASYAREMKTAGAGAAEWRLERLALAYEAAKPYLVSRWRWPDRFSP